MLRHAEYDKAISEIVERQTALGERLRRELQELTALVGRMLSLRLSGNAVADDAKPCDEARARLLGLESTKDELDAMTECVTEMLIARADLGVVPVDREQLAFGIDSIAQYLDDIASGIERNREWIQRQCAERDRP